MKKKRGNKHYKLDPSAVADSLLHSDFKVREIPTVVYDTTDLIMDYIIEMLEKVGNDPVQLEIFFAIMDFFSKEELGKKSY